jgi:2-polyprenyl-3-methyl-5-hydroxy-6-metoxy-1,4-benzoquinol methylase
MQKAEWYVDWFNSPYYHLLYNNRNYEEARVFMEDLCTYLQLGPHARIWDLACGKGRHAISLNRMGFDVIATDLAVNSIREASLHSNPTLEFFVHDMREAFKVNYFDAVFNLFTSIGYFEDVQDNYLVFSNVALSLKPGAIFVIDFLNASKTVSCIKPASQERRGEVTFNITKSVKAGRIVKRIEFEDKGKSYYFEECVSLLKKIDFERFASAAGLRLTHTFGSYKLDTYNEEESDRLILFFTK